VHIAVVSDIVNRDDIRVIQESGAARFAFEVARLAVVGIASAQDLQRHFPSQQRVFGEIHFGTPTSAEMLQYAVAADLQDIQMLFAPDANYMPRAF
jgi:hypothetical protein